MGFCWNYLKAANAGPGTPSWPPIPRRGSAIAGGGGPPGPVRPAGSVPGTAAPLEIDPLPELPPSDSLYSSHRFQDGVRTIKEYISAGDTFQTVLSRRLDLGAEDPFLTYRYLRALNPAPYLYYLHCDDV